MSEFLPSQFPLKKQNHKETQVTVDESKAWYMCFTFQMLSNLYNKINVNCIDRFKTENRQDSEWIREGYSHQKSKAEDGIDKEFQRELVVLNQWGKKILISVAKMR